MQTEKAVIGNIVCSYLLEYVKVLVGSVTVSCLSNRCTCFNPFSENFLLYTVIPAGNDDEIFPCNQKHELLLNVAVQNEVFLCQ